MKIANAKITDFESEFNGMMVQATVNGIEFSEYLTIKEGAAVVERIDSNVKLNMSTELEQTELDADDILDALEEAAQELFQSLYVSEYDDKIVALVPDFDTVEDKESASSWCYVDIDEVSASLVSEIKTAAKASAMKNSLEIAQLLADDFENADNMPRIILIHGTTYSIYDINNLLDIFGRCENGLDFEAIKEAFNRTKNTTSFEAFKKLAQGFEPITDLDDLYQKMLKDHPSVMDKYGNAWSSDLPNFGGEEPDDTDGVWSWDETRLIVGEFAGNLEIITREEYAERQN